MQRHTAADERLQRDSVARRDACYLYLRAGECRFCVRVFVLFRPVNIFTHSFFALCPFSLQAPAFQICVNPALCGTACFRLGDTAANGVMTSFPWNAAHGVRLQYTGGDLCEDASLPQQTPR